MFGKFDKKIIIIVLLVIGLVASIVFGGFVNNDSDDIEQLHVYNEQLIKKIDSLKSVNVEIENRIALIDEQLENNATELHQTQTELEKLKKRKNEIHSYVNGLSADSVANSLSDYIKNRTTSSNSN